MNLFFEESGSFKAGVVLSHAGETYQVELPSGKRIKVKSKEVLLHFETPAPDQLLETAEQVAHQIELNFLWEVAGQEEFGFDELGQEYFGHTPLPHEAAGLLLCVHGAPMYFYRKGRGRYKAAPEAALKAALLGIEKKKQQALIQAEYVESMKAGVLPEAMRPLAYSLLFKPDKNTIAYKAMEIACHDLHESPARLMLRLGGIDSAQALHLNRFLFEHFPQGVGFPECAVSVIPTLPHADVVAFSIDDVTTTEIDDAFSVTVLSDEQVRVGIHIAAPALGMTRDDPVDKIARRRMSTVYMPGDKVTMLPDSWIEQFTLRAGCVCPAVSLYVTLNRADWSVMNTETKIESIKVADNLRHNDLDALVTEETLDQGIGDYPYRNEMGMLWQWAKTLEQGRIDKRVGFGLKPEQTNRMDFNFYVEQGVVLIVPRKRGAPLDKIVSELMIFVNSTWGKWLHECGVPAIYRAQGGGNGLNWAARNQVRMIAHAAPHYGLGVDQYAWSTSPLRRYVDLVNQWQIIACVERGVMAPLVAPFKPKEADLFSVISAFDAAYAAYADIQSNMERYWCLRWLSQKQLKLVEAVVIKEEVVRLVEIPLFIKIPGMAVLARGAQVKLDLIGSDEVDLSVEARLVEVVAVSSVEQEMLDTGEDTSGADIHEMGLSENTI